MASVPSSTLTPDHHHLLCNSLPSPCLLQFPPNQLLHRLRTTTFSRCLKLNSLPALQTSRIPLKAPTAEQNHNSNPQKTSTFENPKGKNGPSSKSHIWVNPNSPRASKLRRKSYSARYATLVKVSDSLNACEAVENEVFDVLINLGEKIVEQDAVIILNNMSNPDTAPIVVKYFHERFQFENMVILYNVALKVYRKCGDLDRAEKLFDEMLKRGVKPDNVTFLTIISCARLSSLPDKSVEWFEKMPSFGCVPDDVTYSVMIDSYGRAGNVDMALSLYDRARAEKWRIDAVTFTTLIKIYGLTGNFDGCLNLYEEMKALGVKLNVVAYNALLDAMGRAKRPWQAKTIYKEMKNSGFKPSWSTYASLLRAYCKSRYGEDAMKVYREMKERGMELNGLLYNALLSTCADVGFTVEAVEIFEDMKRSETCKPDSWTFSSLITVFSCGGKVYEAESKLNEMMEAGFDPNIFVLTSLIQCYGKANRTDDVVRTFDQLIELGITPDERFCGCLLNVMNQTPKEELGKLTRCIEVANSKLGLIVKLLVDEEDIDGDYFNNEARDLFDLISVDVRKAYCNCLIDLCVNLNQLERACELLDLGIMLDIYTDIQSKSATQWSLHLKSLSLGAALTALHVWMNNLSRALENGEELPSLLGINTGHGKHKYSDKGLAGVFESHLKELNAPFHEAPDKIGWFLTTKVAAESWLESRRSQELVAA